jgi:hypothetical protein
MATSASKIAVRCKVRPGGWSQGYPQDVALMRPERGRQVPIVTKIRAAERGSNASFVRYSAGSKGSVNRVNALRVFRVDGAARDRRERKRHINY